MQLGAVSSIEIKPFVEDLVTHSCAWEAYVPSSCFDICDIEPNV